MSSEPHEPAAPRTTRHTAHRASPPVVGRRQLLRSGTGLGVAGALTGLAGSAHGAAGALAEQAVSGLARARVRGRTTLDLVLRRGEPGPTGWRTVVAEPGEQHRLRLDLAGRPRRGRARRRRALLGFVQISDVHVIDAQSPLRVEWTDRYDDPDAPVGPGLFGSAYRPQEMLSAQVAESMVRQVNAIRRGPATGRRLDLVVQTGDNSDNSQLNEVRWNIDVLDGGRVTPDSGDPTRYEGVADDDPASYDRSYWHPEGTPAGAQDDKPRSRYGFPVVPGLLHAARAPFRAQGLRLPWYTAFGNHDGLVQGNFPLNALFDGVARGGLKVITPPPGLSAGDVVEALSTGQVEGLLTQLATAPGTKQVTPDDDRRLLSRAELVEEHFRTSGLPVGHGFTARNRADGTAYYSFDRGLFRFVVLDTVNPNGESGGSLDATQFAWLEQLLARSTDRYVVVASHHSSTSMDNALVGTGGDVEPRVLGPEVVAALLATPTVIAWVDGHSHRNRITPHAREGGGGFWEVNTASHIDWPQQSRILEVADNRDGTLSIFTTVLDHAAPLGAPGLDSPLALAALSRELAANDWQEATAERSGTPLDRNCELVLPRPRLRR